MQQLTSQDIAILLNIVTSIGGFIVLYIKLSERQTRTETHLFHIMKKLGMFDDKTDYLP